MSDERDLFEQLLPAKWRDVEFPVTSMSVTLAHDLVEHKYWGVDGASVEGTGLAPMRFTFSIPLINGIVPGKGEKWATLYPNAMRALLVAFAKRETGILQHPEFDQIPCRAERIEFKWSGDRRGGTECEASFVETKQDLDTTNPFGPSPIQEIELHALDLDAVYADLKKLAPTLPEYEESFQDFARSIQGIGDQATLLSMRVAGKINSIVYRAEQVQDSIDRARSALTWQATNAVERLKSRLDHARERLLQVTGKDLKRFSVPGDTTLAGLLVQLPDAKIGDIIALNPEVMRSAAIAKGTVIRYYAPRLPV